MTYSELYDMATSWTARHVAQDMLLMYGRSAMASEQDIQAVREWNAREWKGGPA